MRILSTEISDILSIQNSRIDFEDNGLVLVEGWNYDTQRANGAGKTAILNCVAFSLYDQLPRKITASEILRRGCKSGWVKTRVLCGEDIWTVIRSRPKGVQYFKNDLQQDITQIEFESVLRLSYTQFLLTIYTPQANSRSLVRFLSSPDTHKKEFLLQLLNLDQFGSAKKAIDEIVKQRQAAIDLESNKLSTVKARIETYQESLIDTTGFDWEMHTLKNTIAAAHQEIIQLGYTVKPDLSKYASTEDGIRKKTAEIAQAKASRNVLHDRWREVKSEIHDYNRDISCNKCGSSLDTPAARTAHDEDQKNLKVKALAIKHQIGDAENIIAKEQDITELSRKLSDKKSKESEQYHKAQNRTTELNAFIKSKQLLVENYNLKLNSNKELSSKIDKLQLDVDTYVHNISNNKKELELYKTLSAVYSPTGAQAYVLDSIVDSFNEVIQKYVDMLSPNMSYILNSFKETSKGDIVAKFSETLTKGGQEVSVGSLSGGEEKGLSLCVDFALLEVLETQFGLNLNPIFLDEPFDGLDTAGREIVIDLLENLARNRQIFVIDHASESKAMFTKFIRVELKNEVSTLNIQV